MQLESTTISLSDADKYKRIIGNYKLISIRTRPHYTRDQYWEAEISDGNKKLTLLTFNPVVLPIGGFVNVDIAFIQNNNGGYWKLIEMNLLNVYEALQSHGFQVNLKKQNDIAKLPLGTQLEYLADPVLLKVKAMFGTGLAKRSRIEEQFSFYETGVLRQMLSWLLSIEYSTEQERDLALCGGMLFLVFNKFLDPSYRLDATRQRDTQFTEIVAQGVSILEKLDTTSTLAN